MQQYINSLPIEDKLTIELAELFEKFGYKKYCMAKFEEYSFYSDNRDFLSGEGIIAFNNSDGRLMALKPDITLSIVKNSRISRDTLTKAYYNESVYRIGKNTSAILARARTLPEATIYATIRLAPAKTNTLPSLYIVACIRSASTRRRNPA